MSRPGSDSGNRSGGRSDRDLHLKGYLARSGDADINGLLIADELFDRQHDRRQGHTVLVSDKRKLGRRVLASLDKWLSGARLIPYLGSAKSFPLRI